MARYENRPAASKTKEDFSSKKVSIVVSEWNEEITGALYSAALSSLKKYGLLKENIKKIDVPGSFELTLASQWAAEKEDCDGVIALGCVIQGDTPHFDYICQSVAYGITEVNLKFNKPVIFGVLTTLNHQQALDRAGGKHGNKGEEAADTLVKMWQAANF